jgi:hypothetical protein
MGSFDVAMSPAFRPVLRRLLVEGSRTGSPLPTPGYVAASLSVRATTLLEGFVVAVQEKLDRLPLDP